MVKNIFPCFFYLRSKNKEQEDAFTCLKLSNTEATTALLPAYRKSTSPSGQFTTGLVKDYDLRGLSPMSIFIKLPPLTSGELCHVVRELQFCHQT